MDAEKRLLGNVMIVIGILGLIVQLISPLFIVAGCFGGNSLSKFLPYCICFIIIFRGVYIRKYKAVSE